MSRPSREEWLAQFNSRRTAALEKDAIAAEVKAEENADKAIARKTAFASKNTVPAPQGKANFIANQDGRIDVVDRYTFSDAKVMLQKLRIEGPENFGMAMAIMTTDLLSTTSLSTNTALPAAATSQALSASISYTAQAAGELSAAASSQSSILQPNIGAASVSSEAKLEYGKGIVIKGGHDFVFSPIVKQGENYFVDPNMSDISNKDIAERLDLMVEKRLKPGKTDQNIRRELVEDAFLIGREKQPKGSYITPNEQQTMIAFAATLAFDKARVPEATKLIHKTFEENTDKIFYKIFKDKTLYPGGGRGGVEELRMAVLPALPQMATELENRIQERQSNIKDKSTCLSDEHIKQVGDAVRSGANLKQIGLDGFNNIFEKALNLVPEGQKEVIRQDIIDVRKEFATSPISPDEIKPSKENAKSEDLSAAAAASSAFRPTATVDGTINNSLRALPLERARSDRDGLASELMNEKDENVMAAATSSAAAAVRNDSPSVTQLDHMDDSSPTPPRGESPQDVAITSDKSSSDESNVSEEGNKRAKKQKTGVTDSDPSMHSSDRNDEPPPPPGASGMGGAASSLGSSESVNAQPNQAVSSTGYQEADNNYKSQNSPSNVDMGSLTPSNEAEESPNILTVDGPRQNSPSNVVMHSNSENNSDEKDGNKNPEGQARASSSSSQFAALLASQKSQAILATFANAAREGGSPVNTNDEATEIGNISPHSSPKASQQMQQSPQSANR